MSKYRASLTVTNYNNNKDHAKLPGMIIFKSYLYLGTSFNQSGRTPELWSLVTVVSTRTARPDYCHTTETVKSLDQSLLFSASSMYLVTLLIPYDSAS